ncbi:unnamed protein product [Spirodela intermedia]|uniref:Uncharacterized protein n=1 Tax=Spirodela intermedia TaxID=51605 RepID=A0A7I8LGF1_SPIIN|nr:unnamed protein product [Spirodela intermedia]
MNWLSHKPYLYEVTFGLYVLDWCERYSFNAAVLTLLWFICSAMLKTSVQFYDCCLVASNIDVVFPGNFHGLLFMEVMLLFFLSLVNKHNPLLEPSSPRSPSA